MEIMADERLGGVRVETLELFTSGDSDTNPINTHVFLHLYRIQLSREPDLNPKYYTDGAWLNFEELWERTRDATCGSCMRMWWDHASLIGLAPGPYPGGERR